MRIKAILVRTFSIFTLLAFSNIFPNTNTVGGFISVNRNLIVIPNYGFECKDPNQLTEVATLTIDNNFPTSDLVLEFADLEGTDNIIADVRLQEVRGTLGQGLIPPGESRLIHEGGHGRFIWKPGTQQTPTLGYQVRVLVTFNKMPTVPPQLTVSMPYYL